MAESGKHGPTIRVHFFIFKNLRFLNIKKGVPDPERKTSLCRLARKEATRGFEPLMRVLQTLALPLGHVAIMNLYSLETERAMGLEPTTFSLARRCSTN